MRISRPIAFLAAIALLSFLLPAAHAQTTYGAITGTARDATGAVAPGVKVTVTNEATGVSQTQQTNEVGSFAFTTLYPGSDNLDWRLDVRRRI